MHNAFVAPLPKFPNIIMLVLSILLFFFEREISLIDGQTASTISIKEKQDIIRQDQIKFVFE